MLNYKTCPFCLKGQKNDMGNHVQFEVKKKKIPAFMHEYSCGTIGFFYYLKGNKVHFEPQKCVDSRRKSTIDKESDIWNKL